MCKCVNEQMDALLYTITCFLHVFKDIELQK